MLVVFTIGHSTRTWKLFLDLLRAHGIKRVVDVRSIPRSRHNPQFNRETLSMKLRSARIGYAHLRKLGGLRRARRDSPNMGWRNTSFRGFADYMQTADFDAGLGRLIKLAKQKKTALMCAEAVPWRCHRSLVADALLIRGIRVADIISSKRSQSHRLTSFGHLSLVAASPIENKCIAPSCYQKAQARTSALDESLSHRGVPCAKKCARIRSFHAIGV
jgi:uncharacterized protein (DUF488 family)